MAKGLLVVLRCRDTVTQARGWALGKRDEVEEEGDSSTNTHWPAHRN